MVNLPIEYSDSKLPLMEDESDEKIHRPDGIRGFEES